jgi:hypothetical protein
MSCTGTVNVTNADELVNDKWNSVESLAKVSSDAALAAIKQIQTDTQSAGFALKFFSGTIPDPGGGFITPPYRFPSAPSLLAQAYQDPTPYNQSLTLPPVVFKNPGVRPEFTATPPPNTLPAISFNLPPDPGDFSDAYVPPSVEGFRSIAAPGPFTATLALGPAPAFASIVPPPEFDASLPAPLPLPTVPSLTVRPLGDVPDVVSPEYPTAPLLAMPGEPQSLNIPLPTLRFPDLSGIDGLLEGLLANRPVEPVMSVPEDLFLNTFDSLRSSLGAELQPSLPVEETLTWMLSGDSIGIPADVAQGLRDRAFGAEDRQAYQAEVQVMQDWLSRGFTLPGGAMDARIMAVRQTSRDKKGEINRDLWLEEAKLEIEGLRFAVTQGIAYQGLLWDTKIKLWGVCAELANRYLDVQIKVLETTLAIYREKMSAWQTEAGVTRDYIAAKLQSELALLDITKSETEIAGLFVDINRQNVDLYRAKLDGISTEVDLYKARIDAANSQMQGQTLKLEAFAQQVAAYSATVRAFEAEWSGYSAAVSADNARIDGFRALVQAYGARVDAFGTRVNAESARVSSVIDSDRLRLDEFRTRADVYGTAVNAYGNQVNAERARVEAGVALAKLPLDAYVARTQAYSTKIDAYGKRIDAERTRVGAEVDIFKFPIDIFTAQAQAYNSQVSGYASSVQASSAEAQSQIEVGRLRLDEWRAGLENYKAQLEAAVSRFRADIDRQASRVNLYRAEVDAESANTSSRVSAADQSLRVRQQNVDIQLKELELAQTRLFEMVKIAQDGSSEIGRVASQLAGSALSAVNASASISQGYGTSRSISCSESYSY